MRKDTETPKLNSSLDLNKSLLYKVLTSILSEIRGEKNTWYAGEHFRNDPREHPGERFLHFIENGGVTDVINRVKRENPSLIYTPGSLAKKGQRQLI